MFNEKKYMVCNKDTKSPWNHFGNHEASIHDSHLWMTCMDAHEAASSLNGNFWVSYVVTGDSGVFCLDIDCDKKLPPDQRWSALTLELKAMFPNGYHEISNSGAGWHVWGKYSGEPLSHRMKSKLGIEFFTQKKHVLLGALGCIPELQDCTVEMNSIIEKYFFVMDNSDPVGNWTTTPCEIGAGIADDDELLQYALNDKQPAWVMFDGSPSLSDYFYGTNFDKLNKAHPFINKNDPYDRSEVEFELIRQLSYYTAGNCAQLERLMNRSTHKRKKWEDNKAYLSRTILRAVAAQPKFYKKGSKKLQVTLPTDNTIDVLSAFPIPANCEAGIKGGTHNTRPLTDLGNTLRLLDKYKHTLRYIYDSKSWLNWDKDHSVLITDDSKVLEFAKTLPLDIHAEGLLWIEANKEFANWAHKSSAASNLKSSVDLLKSESTIRITSSFLDNDDFLIGLNGAKTVVDLRTGLCRPVTFNDYATKSIACNQVGESHKALRFHKFLDEIFEGDREIINWLKRWCGYCLTGSMIEEFFVFCHGSGDNGKSVLVKLIGEILGDYANVIKSELLTQVKPQSAEAASPFLMGLVGSRFVATNETEERSTLNESFTKNIVSRDKQTGRKNYGSPENFYFSFKMMMMGNHKPNVRGADHSIWKRIRLLPFNKTFSKTEIDRDLPKKLALEHEHILAWMIEGCLEWQKVGLKDIPQSIIAATREYKEEQDELGDWLNDCINTKSLSDIEKSQLYANYKSHVIMNGSLLLSEKQLSRKLSDRGFVKRKSSGKVFWRGLSIINLPLFI